MQKATLVAMAFGEWVAVATVTTEQT